MPAEKVEFESNGASVCSITEHPKFTPVERDLSSGPPLPDRVVAVVREFASKIPDVSAAYVSSDGAKFVMCGPLKPNLPRQVARAVYEIQERIDPKFETFVDGSYSPDASPLEGWLVAFVR